MGMRNKIVYSLIGIAFVGGLFSAAYAGPVLTTITLAGNTLTLGDAQVDGNLNVDGILTATNLAVGPHTVDTNAGTICATGELLDGDGNCIPIPADGADGADGSDGISPLTSIRVTTTEPEFLLPTDETVIGVAPTSHIFLPLGIPDGKIIVIKNAGCGCILSAQEDDEILNGDIILGFTDAVVLQYLNGIWFEIAEYAGLPAPP